MAECMTGSINAHTGQRQPKRTLQLGKPDEVSPGLRVFRCTKIFVQYVTAYMCRFELWRPGVRGTSDPWSYGAVWALAATHKI